MNLNNLEIPVRQSLRLKWQRARQSGNSVIVGFSAASITLALVLAAQILLVPVFLRGFGVTGYADWLLLTAFPSYLTLMDFGLSSSAATQATAFRIEGNNSSADRMLSSAGVVIASASAVVVALGSVCAAFVPIDKLLGLRQLDHRDAATVVAVYLAYIAGCLLTDFLVGCYRSQGAFGAGLNASNAIRLAEMLATVAVLLASPSPITLACVLAVCRYLGLLLMGTRYSLNYGSGAIAFRNAEFIALRSVIAPGIAFMAFPIGNALLNQGVTVTLGVVATPEVLVAFTVGRTISSSIRQVNNVVIQATMPRLSVLLAKGQSVLARQLSRRGLLASLLVTTGLCSPLFVFGPTIVSTWLSRGGLVDGAFLNLMLLQTLADTPWLLAYAVLVASNQHGPIALRYFLGSVGAVVLVPAAFHLLGLNGVALALLVPTLAVTPRALLDRRRAFAIATEAKIR